jgi:predicted dehydrogenase
LAGSKNARLRVGVVGLGRLWEARHKPALAKMTERFQVTAVYDQVARRAEIEAAQVGAEAVDGLISLVERPDVDAIYLLTPQWFGLFPIELACAARKPIYCALPIAGCLEDLERIDGLVRGSGVAFMPEFARRFYPTSLRLRELLATRLGPPRLVIGQGRLFGFDRYGQPGPSTQIAPATLLVDPGSYLLDWCRFVFGSDPSAVQGFGGTVLPESVVADPDFETFLLEFDGGALAQISAGRYHRDAWGEASRFLPQPGIQVFAERGVAWLEMPDRIQWTDEEGPHDERLPLEPTVGELLNDHFHRLVRGAQTLAPSWDDTIAVARTLEEIRRSGVEGRRITITPPS